MQYGIFLIRVRAVKISEKDLILLWGSVIIVYIIVQIIIIVYITVCDLCNRSIILFYLASMFVSFVFAGYFKQQDDLETAYPFPHQEITEKKASKTRDSKGQNGLDL